MFALCSASVGWLTNARLHLPVTSTCRSDVRMGSRKKSLPVPLKSLLCLTWMVNGAGVVGTQTLTSTVRVTVTELAEPPGGRDGRARLRNWTTWPPAIAKTSGTVTFAEPSCCDGDVLVIVSEMV